MSVRACKGRKGFPICLQKYANKIDTRKYGDYTITENYFSQYNLFQRASEKRIICTIVFERQHRHIGKKLIPFCKKTTYRYHLNILSIIVIIYYVYIECELYNLAYTQNQNINIEQESISLTMGEWDDND